jgi:hypothetical protein
MRYAALERSQRSRSWLLARHGSLLREWARLRAAAWAIPPASSAKALIRKIDSLCTNEVWAPLAARPAVVRLDDMLRDRVGGLYPPSPPELAERLWHYSPEPLTVDDVERLMKLWHPNIPRLQVRRLLMRAERRHLVVREKRGVYVADPGGIRRREREDRADDDDEGWERYLSKSRRDARALMIHYLLPRVAAYRKAAALGLSERAYYYAIGHTIEWTIGDLEDDARFRRASQRAIRAQCADLGD